MPQTSAEHQTWLIVMPSAANHLQRYKKAREKERCKREVKALRQNRKTKNGHGNATSVLLT
jgi:hypothetical protein